jgi:catechol 2,3-dioxygenase-like lactoylglutathione lyase family enzyme
MSIKRMDNVLIVVEDLDAAIAFFVDLGMELEGRMPVEGRWVDRVIGIDGTRGEIATLRTPDGHGRIELDKFYAPEAVTPAPNPAPVNTLGLRRIMFAVDDIDAVVARLQAKGTELVGDVVDYEGIYRLCYVRGPEGLLLGLAQDLR